MTLAPSPDSAPRRSTEVPGSGDGGDGEVVDRGDAAGADLAVVAGAFSVEDGGAVIREQRRGGPVCRVG